MGTWKDPYYPESEKVFEWQFERTIAYPIDHETVRIPLLNGYFLRKVSTTNRPLPKGEFKIARYSRRGYDGLRVYCREPRKELRGSRGLCFIYERYPSSKIRGGEYWQ